MNRKLLIAAYLVCTCLILAECKSQSISTVQIVFFDLNDFNRTDTIFINNINTVNSIKALFNNMVEADAKFPRRYEIKIIGKGFSDVYYSNGKYVRNNRKVYMLPEGKEFVLFESILNHELNNNKATH